MSEPERFEFLILGSGGDVPAAVETFQAALPALSR
jgi:hypothetical protein